MRRAFLLIITLLGIAALIGLPWLASRHRQLTEMPARGATAPDFDAVESTIGVAVSAPLGRLQQEINNRIPASFHESGHGEDVCKDIFGQKVCAGTTYDVTLTRGQIGLSAPNATMVRIDVPLAASGSGGLRGDGAKLLGLGKKNFTASAHVAAELSLTLDDDGCPRAVVTAQLQDVPSVEVEIVGGVWVDVAWLLTKAIAGLGDQIMQAVTVAIPCDIVRQQIAREYTSRHFKLTVPNAPAAFMNFRPSGLAFSGLHVDAENLRVAAAISGTFQIEPSPIDVAAVPLPVIQPLHPVAPLAKLAVPLRVPYEDLTMVATQAIVGKLLPLGTPAGAARVTVAEIEFFPSGTRLAARIKFVADLPERWLDVRGEAYLLATPRVENGVVVSLTDIAFTRVVDNDLWNALTAAFEKSIRESVEQASRVDLSPVISEVVERVESALEAPIGGAVVHVDGLTLSIGRVAVAKDNLSVEGLVEGRVLVVPAP